MMLVLFVGGLRFLLLPFCLFLFVEDHLLFIFWFSVINCVFVLVVVFLCLLFLYHFCFCFILYWC